MTIQQQTDMAGLLEFDRADRMRRALRISGVSVEEMCEYLGVSRGAVSSWINGRVSPRKATIMAFALRTGVPFEWIETGRIPATAPNGPVGPAGIEPTTSTVKAGRLVALPSRGAPKMRELAVAS